MVNLPALVHRPQSRSMKDLVHLLLPRVRFTCTKCTDVWPARGKSQSSFPVMLPPVVSSPASPSSGAGVQLMWAKAWPCHSGCPGEVNVVVGRLQLAGRGERRRGFVGVPGRGCSGSESPVGGVCELHGASTTMVGMLKELLVLPVAPAMVVEAKRRRWRFDEMRCGNAGLRWASSSAKVSAVCLSSWRS